MFEKMYDAGDLLKNLDSFNTPGYKISSLVIIILGIVAMWKIFEKAGEQGWKALIPFYNFYTLCKLLKLNFWIFLAACICIIIPFVNIVAIFVIIYYAFASQYRLSKAFGHGFGFFLGLLFLSFIFQLILAFNSDTYQPENI